MNTFSAFATAAQPGYGMMGSLGAGAGINLSAWRNDSRNKPVGSLILSRCQRLWNPVMDWRNPGRRIAGNPAALAFL